MDIEKLKEVADFLCKGYNKEKYHKNKPKVTMPMQVDKAKSLALNLTYGKGVYMHKDEIDSLVSGCAFKFELNNVDFKINVI